MCSIAGIIHGTANDRERVAEMNRLQRHRGPDGDGCFFDGEVALGHRRLAVIDVATGAQPLDNEDHSVHIVFNGEVYNFRELRTKLEQTGRHKFRTRSDTEVIVHLYEEYGVDAVAKLRGMFALAIYDKRRRRVVLARDRAGQKPLFYHTSGNFCAFASEIQALMSLQEVPRTIEPAAVGDFLSFQYVPGPGTIYREVHKLPAGHVLSFSLEDGAVSLFRYWQLDFWTKTTLPEVDAAVHLRELLTDAVAARLISDVPLGTFLSGGLDSAVITALTVGLADRHVKAFTAGFDNPAYDERAAAELSADFIHVRHDGLLDWKCRTVTADAFDEVESMIPMFGQPFADASMIPCRLLSRFARQEITVALSGDGADELFGGYERYIAMRCAHHLDFIPQSLRHFGVGIFRAVMPGGGDERSTAGRLLRAAELLDESPERRYFKLLDRCPAERKRALFVPELTAASEADSARFFDLLFDSAHAADPVEKLMELDFHGYMADDVLTKVDTASMAEALEVRSPFLDHHVMEFAASLPVEYKLAGRSRKHLLKLACADLVAPEVLAGAKRGFGVPVAEFLRTSWRKRAEGHLFGNADLRMYFQEPAIRKLWQEHQSREHDWSYLLWNLVVFAIFLGRMK